jgi:hypothetical protein
MLIDVKNILGYKKAAANSQIYYGFLKVEIVLLKNNGRSRLRIPNIFVMRNTKIPIS